MKIYMVCPITQGDDKQRRSNHLLTSITRGISDYDVSASIATLSGVKTYTSHVTT